MFRLYPSPAEVEAPHTIYDAITFPPPPPERPYTWINMVATLDGRVTLGRGRIRTPLGSKLDRILMSRLRVHADAVLQGAGTVRDAGYFPRVPDDLRAQRRAAGREEHPLAVVVTRTCDLPFDAPFFRQVPGRTLILTTGRAMPERVEAARAVAEVVVLGEDQVDLAGAMAYLRRERGVAYLLSEGGPSLNHSFFAQGLADELFLTVAPRIGGYRADLTAVDGPAVLEPCRSWSRSASTCTSGNSFSGTGGSMGLAGAASEAAPGCPVVTGLPLNQLDQGAGDGFLLRLVGGPPEVPQDGLFGGGRIHLVLQEVPDLLRLIDQAVVSQAGPLPGVHRFGQRLLPLVPAHVQIQALPPFHLAEPLRASLA